MKKFGACVLVVFFSMMFVVGPLCFPVMAASEDQDAKNLPLALLLLLLVVGAFALTTPTKSAPPPVVVPQGPVSKTPFIMPSDSNSARTTMVIPEMKIPGSRTQLSLSGGEVAIRF